MTASNLAKLGMQVIIGCRNPHKANKAITYLKKVTGNPQIEYLPLDLSSLDSVVEFVDMFEEKQLPLNLLINNAGLFNQRGITTDGFELIFSTNYLGHFLLTQSLLNKLIYTENSCILMIASDLALKVSSLDWHKLTQRTPLNFLEAYSVSKLCLLLYSFKLSELIKNKQVRVNSIHPGFVQSNITIGHRLSKYLGIGISPEVSAEGIVNIVNNPKLATITGEFLNYKGEKMSLTSLAKDKQLANELWKKSKLWTEKYLNKISGDLIL